MGELRAQEFKVVSLRECPLPDTLHLCDEPGRAAEYWRTLVVSHPAFSAEVECFVVLLLNTRRRVKGHVLVATGTLDTILIRPREVFRAAVIAGASAVVLMQSSRGYTASRFMPHGRSFSWVFQAKIGSRCGIKLVPFRSDSRCVEESQTNI